MTSSYKFIKKLITGTYSNNQMHSAKFLVQATKISASLDHEKSTKYLVQFLVNLQIEQNNYFLGANEIQPS